AGADRVLDLAEAAGEGQLLLVVELLVVENEHGVGVHAGVDRRHRLRRQRPRQVEAIHFSGEAGTDLAEPDGPGPVPPLTHTPLRRPGLGPGTAVTARPR